MESAWVSVSDPAIRTTADGGAQVGVDFLYEGKKKRLWFSVEAPFASYIAAERADGFMVALLSWAMECGVNLRFTAPVSRTLYFTVTRFLIPTLKASYPWRTAIRIEAPVTDVPLPCAGACGTGLSCGIDSLATVADYLLASDAPPAPHRLTHVAFFNVGAHGHGDKCPEVSVRRVFSERLAHSRRCAQALGCPLVVVDSNLMDYVVGSFLHNVTLCNCAAVLVLQKLFGIYYVSSTLQISKIKMDGVLEHLEPVLLPLLRTETLTFFSSGMTSTRVEKTERVSRHPLAYEFLNVCVVESHNCSRCNKCLRTIMTLDLLRRLDAFDKVFDVTFFKRSRSRLWAKGGVEFGNEPLMQEVLSERRRRRVRLPMTYPFWRGYYLLRFLPARIRRWGRSRRRR